MIGIVHKEMRFGKIVAVTKIETGCVELSEQRILPPVFELPKQYKILTVRAHTKFEPSTLTRERLESGGVRANIREHVIGSGRAEHARARQIHVGAGHCTRNKQASLFTWWLSSLIDALRFLERRASSYLCGSFRWRCSFTAISCRR